VQLSYSAIESRFQPVRPHKVEGRIYSTRVIYLFLIKFLFPSATLRAHRMELDQILPHTGKWARFANPRPKLGVPP